MCVCVRACKWKVWGGGGDQCESEVGGGAANWQKEKKNFK